MLVALLFAAGTLAACSPDSRQANAGETAAAHASSASGAARAAAQALPPPPANALASTPVQTPVLFVIQVPTDGDVFASRLSTFANHMTSMTSVPRGGGLVIRYPDGSLRDLTREAGFGMDGRQGANAIAVREPTVHWSGTKAIFSMLVGAPAQQYGVTNGRWQMYEVSGLAQGQVASITRVANQPAYNNVSPLYGSDDSILFTSDRPRNGAAHLHPQLDEYESTPIVTGLFRLDPASGAVRILNHAPSGAFSPVIDSYGRIVFTRWDHLQRDQQQDAGTSGSFDFESEAADAAPAGTRADVFPEARLGMDSPYGPVGNYHSNIFMPWQVNQDGSFEQTLNHVGRHEVTFGFLGRSFAGDPSLSDNTDTSLIANRKFISQYGGLFHLREDPTQPGIYYGINTAEFGSLTTSQIIRLSGAPHLNPEQMVITDASPAPSGAGLSGGRFRNPLPMTSGHMVAAHTPSAQAGAGIELRLRQVVGTPGTLAAGPALTPGIVRSVSWWTPDSLRSFEGALWEIEPVEVAARPRPPHTSEAVLQSPERALFASEGVDEGAFRSWLRANDLAIIVTRNQTSRDRSDRQQPYNLRVPGGTQTVANGGIVYDIAHFQVLQGNLVRAYRNSTSGRRVLAQPIDTGANPGNPLGPDGSVRIEADGSTAAFVPANRALTWQTVDSNGVPVVRERVWITMQPGEIRTCGGCHGENTRNQAGQPEPANAPTALRTLLRHWKQSGTQPAPRDGSAPLLPPAP
ncbi:hypothetical protein WCE34_06670 [Luteimonas sp. MJ204]|uniref:HzsA-related protein n=1 Tax=Luteimonas sp. MJ145 TaxID=3129234 RepID=UPI0031B9AEB7